MKSRVTETCQNRVWTCWFMLQATTTIRSGQAWSQHAGGPSHWCHFPLPPQMPSQENWIRSRAATTWTGIKQRMLASQLNSLYHFIFQFLINLFIWKEESHTERKRQREFFHSDMVATARTRPGQRQFFPRSGQCHFFSKVYQVDGRGFAQYFLPYLCVSICLKGTATDTHTTRICWFTPQCLYRLGQAEAKWQELHPSVPPTGGITCCLPGLLAGGWIRNREETWF